MATIDSTQSPPTPLFRPNLWGLTLVGLAAALAVVFVLSLLIGSVRIPPGEVVAILLGNQPSRAAWKDIVLLFRLPKAITASLAGASLAVAGLQMQTFFRNPLADPYVLGISSGAGLGVALVVLATGNVLSGTSLLAGLGLAGNISVVAAASIGAALVMILVIIVARNVQTMTLLILGLMFGYVTSAAVSLLLYFSIAERIQAYIAWSFGTFGNMTWDRLTVLIPTLLVALGIAQLLVKPLNALLLGEAYARSMGLAISHARFWIIASASILAGAVTAFCGPISFLGIAIPHLCRSLLGTSDHRILVPATTLAGALVALLVDMVAQVPGSRIVLPLNAITALIGAPVVIWVLLRNRNLKAFAS